jgi:hypothetical protein
VEFPSWHISWDHVGFMRVRVVAKSALPINTSHLKRRLLLWCAGSLEPNHGDFPCVYYNKFYYDKFCPSPVKGGEDWSAPSTRSSGCSLQ